MQNSPVQEKSQGDFELFPESRKKSATFVSTSGKRVKFYEAKNSVTAEEWTKTEMCMAEPFLRQLVLKAFKAETSKLKKANKPKK